MRLSDYDDDDDDEDCLLIRDGYRRGNVTNIPYLTLDDFRTEALSESPLKYELFYSRVPKGVPKVSTLMYVASRSGVDSSRFP